jgi:hypothetical protein
MKRVLVLVSFFFCCTGAFAQAHTVTTEYQKSMQPAIEVDVPYAEKTVTNSLIEKFEKRGYKGKESKGFLIFKGVRIDELGKGEYDLYFKVDRKSRQQKEASVLTVLISSGYDKFISESDNPDLFDNAKKMLNEQTGVTAAHDLELQIQEQDEISKKEDKKLAALASDSVNLQKKKLVLDTEILENSKKQEAQKAEIEKQRLILETLKARRKQ